MLVSLSCQGLYIACKYFQQQDSLCRITSKYTTVTVYHKVKHLPLQKCGSYLFTSMSSMAKRKKTSYNTFV